MAVAALSAGLAPYVRTIAQSVAEWQQKVAASIGPAVEAIGRAAVMTGRTLAPVIDYLSRLEAAKPPNWPTVLAYPRLHDLAKDGFPVIWVPAAPVLTELMDARTVIDRQNVLLGHADEVIENARAVLGEVTHADLAEHARVVHQALDCVRTNDAPAQALSLQVATVAAAHETGHETLAGLATHLKALLEPDAIVTPTDLRSAMTLLAVGPLLARFRPGDPVPTTPNRHAISHTVSSLQYTPGNALWSVLVAVSVLRQAQENREPRLTAQSLEA